MEILFIAPLPPPIHGQSKASNAVLEALQSSIGNIYTVDINKSSLHSGGFALSRIKEVLGALFDVWKNRLNKDIVYLSLSESVLGNLRDLIVYAIFANRLDRVYVHMLGGAGMKEILAANSFNGFFTRYFMKRLGGVIVEGKQNFEMFARHIEKERIHIIPNFAEEYLFLSEEEISVKFSHTNKINILYLSNLLPGKGYQELVDAYMSLPSETRSKFNLTFVGGFASLEDEKAFLNLISSETDITYLGKFIDGKDKKDLFFKSHIFCLPTYYPFEGQPIAILEAYASACFVITTYHSGIPFVFKDGANGKCVDTKSSASIAAALIDISLYPELLSKVAMNNRNEAFLKYRLDNFKSLVRQVFLLP